MLISYSQFHLNLLGAALIDDQRWSHLNIRDWIWNHYAFGDDGVYFINDQWPEDCWEALK